MNLFNTKLIQPSLFGKCKPVLASGTGNIGKTKLNNRFRVIQAVLFPGSLLPSLGGKKEKKFQCWSHGQAVYPL